HTIAPAWDVWAAGLYGSSGSCCFTGPAVNMTFSSAGVWRISAMAIDQELNTSPRPSTVVRIGTPAPTGEPPIAAVSLDKMSGPVPLTVNVDMHNSVDQDGTIQYYYIGCGGVGFASGSSSPYGTCTYDTPGAYWMLLQVQDNSGQMDLISA